MKKSCRACGKHLPLTAFWRNSAKKDGHFDECRKCRNRMAAQVRVEDPTRMRRYHLQKRYGLSEEEFDRLFEVCKGRCQICRRREDELPLLDGKPQRLHVDHNHRTGEIRGLLCIDCNLGLGRFHDSFELLSNAMDYVTGVNTPFTWYVDPMVFMR